MSEDRTEEDNIFLREVMRAELSSDMNLSITLPDHESLGIDKNEMDPTYSAMTVMTLMRLREMTIEASPTHLPVDTSVEIPARLRLLLDEKRSAHLEVEFGPKMKRIAESEQIALMFLIEAFFVAAKQS